MAVSAEIFEPVSIKTFDNLHAFEIVKMLSAPTFVYA